MNVLKLLIPLSLVVGYVTNISAQTSATDIQTMLEHRDGQIKIILGPKGSEYSDAQRDTLKAIINGIIDFERNFGV